MTDSSEWNGAGLRRDIRRFFAMTKFDGVAVGIDNEQRFVDRARIGVIGEPLPTKFLFLRLANRGGKIIRGDLEPPNDSFHAPSGCRRQAIILKSETESRMIGDGEKHDHGHFSIEPADVQVGMKAKPRAHERRPKAKRAPEIVGRKHAVIYSFHSHRWICARHVRTPYGVYIRGARGRQAGEGIRREA